MEPTGPDILPDILAKKPWEFPQVPNIFGELEDEGSYINDRNRSSVRLLD